MVAGEAVPPDGPAAQPARPIRAGFGFSIFRNHPGDYTARAMLL